MVENTKCRDGICGVPPEWDDDPIPHQFAGEGWGLLTPMIYEIDC